MGFRSDICAGQSRLFKNVTLPMLKTMLSCLKRKRISLNWARCYSFVHWGAFLVRVYTVYCIYVCFTWKLKRALVSLSIFYVLGFFKKIFLGLFLPLFLGYDSWRVDRKQEREGVWHAAKGHRWNQTPGRCGEDTASVYGEPALPPEPPDAQYFLCLYIF